MIPVTKPYLPKREKLDKYLDGIYSREWLTNNGVLVQELTRRLEEHLGVENLLLVANGTLALQVAYRVLGVSGTEFSAAPEAVTTPFTFIATASSLKWEGVQPIFSDIDPDSWCLNPSELEKAITSNTRAVVPVHVFGNSCDTVKISNIAQKNNLKVVYDASHAFGVKLNGESLLKQGDASTLSFHATKLFHTGEGGAIIFRRKEDWARAKDMINFGITGPESVESLGINAKMNELQAAMGLCVLDEMGANRQARAAVWHRYQKALGSVLKLQKISSTIEYNYSYLPVLFESEEQVLGVVSTLKENGIMSRRYFYPSLDSLEYLGRQVAKPVSSSISKRILCLPIYSGLAAKTIDQIADLIIKAISR